MYIAIDLGGTKTLTALIDENGEVKKATKFPTNSNYPEFIQQLKQTIDELRNGQQIVAACMAIPGTIDRENGIILQLGNLSWPKNTPIKADLATFLECPVTIENDANLAGLSEAILIREQYRKALYITISTGIGGGYIVNGVLDPNLLDSEIGHMVFEYEGTIQDWEDFASGSWIVKTFGKRASDLDDEQAWKKISANIAIGIINSSIALCPDVIIIGGGVGSHLPKFKSHLDEAIAKINPSFNSGNIPPIVQAQRPEEAVLYGCYELARQTI